MCNIPQYICKHYAKYIIKFYVFIFTNILIFVREKPDIKVTNMFISWLISTKAKLKQRIK